MLKISEYLVPVDDSCQATTQRFWWLQYTFDLLQQCSLETTKRKANYDLVNFSNYRT